jgi:transcriptional regulator with XRE-family HTH domain
MDMVVIGARIRDARRRRGLLQRELARDAGVSLSLVRKLEQGDYDGGLRLETVHRLAVALDVTTSALMSEPDAPEADNGSAAAWDATRAALRGDHVPAGDEPPTIGGVRDALNDATGIYLDSRFADLSRVLPFVLRDADALADAADGNERARARQVRAQARQIAAISLCQSWLFGAAAEAADLAMGDSGDDLTMMASVHARCFVLLRQGLLAETSDVAARWAREAEPARISTATPDDLAAWGRLLIWVSNAAVRDNRPDDARDALRLARMAAAGASRDYIPPSQQWGVFGPATVAMVSAEHAMISGKPELTLRIGRQVTGRGFPAPRNFYRHRLDVAHALAVTRKHDEAVGVMTQLRSVAPEWLVQQRYARDILAKVMTRRRTLTSDMRDLADFLRVPV